MGIKSGLTAEMHVVDVDASHRGPPKDAQHCISDYAVLGFEPGAPMRVHLR